MCVTGLEPLVAGGGGVIGHRPISARERSVMSNRFIDLDVNLGSAHETELHSLWRQSEPLKTSLFLLKQYTREVFILRRQTRLVPVVEMNLEEKIGA